MNPRRRLAWKMKARATNKTPDVVVANVVVDTAPENLVETVAHEVAAETVEVKPVTTKKIARKRSTYKTTTTKKK